jgi:nitronate monooxygenase
MLVACSLDDVTTTKAVSGVLANWMRPRWKRPASTPVPKAARASTLR